MPRLRDEFYDQVIEDRRGHIIEIEVKASATVRANDLRGLRQLQAAVGDKFVEGLPARSRPYQPV